MSDGGYSRLEKDFLGNERMVHYDGSGNMIGASDVVREPDGTLRVSNDPVNTFNSTDLPDVKVIEPTPKAEPKPQIPADAGKAAARQMPMGQTMTYVIATFIGAMLLTLAALAFNASRGRGVQTSPRFETTSNYSQPQNQTPYQAQPMPDRTPDQYPADPKPRNDEQPDDTPQTAPDMNTGDDNRPKIEPDLTAPDTTDPGKKKGGSDDPIDLRGGDEPGKAGPAKNGPAQTDPNDIH